MQQSMQISLLCSTEHKEENMIFINSPFAILDEAFRSLYPDKKYKACIEPSIKDDEEMSDEEMLEAMEQAVKMHFMAFQQFMKQTGGDIGLSLRLTTSYTAAMLKGLQEQSEKEEKLLKLLLPSGESNLTN